MTGWHDPHSFVVGGSLSKGDLAHIRDPHQKAEMTTHPMTLAAMLQFLWAAASAMP